VPYREALRDAERKRAELANPQQPADVVLDLQRTAGNVAVTGLLQRRTKTVITRGGGLGGDQEDEMEGGDEKVKAWQRFLNQSEAGKIPEKLVIDGICGPLTDTATRLHEWRSGKPIAGKVGEVVETQGGGL
jgi:hypothetical protein